MWFLPCLILYIINLPLWKHYSISCFPLRYITLVARQQKYLRAKTGGVEDDMHDDSEEEEEKKALWGRSKSMYYSADNVDYEVITPAFKLCLFVYPLQHKLCRIFLINASYRLNHYSSMATNCVYLLVDMHVRLYEFFTVELYLKCFDWRMSKL